MPAGFIVAAIIFAAAFPALAQDVPLPPLTPEGEYRLVTQNDGTTTSDCIGKPVTPLCAVETKMATNVRGNLDYSRIAMGLKGVPLFDERGPGPPIIYRVVRTEVLTDKTFPWRPESDLNWRPGGSLCGKGISGSTSNRLIATGRFLLRHANNSGARPSHTS